MKIPVYSIKILGYNVRKKPDHNEIGKKIDKIIKKHFLGKKIAIRVLSSSEHNGKTVIELISLIKKLGTDRYNPQRKGDRYENIDKKKIDFFALPYLVKEKTKMMFQFIEAFYIYPIRYKEKPIRIDLILIYDLSKVKQVKYRYKGYEYEKREGEKMEDGFVFKNSKNKKEALIGIIQVKR